MWIVLLLGLLGTIVPGLPGTGLIYLAILGYAWHFGWSTVGVGVLVVLGILTLFSFVIDFVSGAVGAKHFGATRYAMQGAIVGGIIGLIVGHFPGMLLGIFLGAVVGEHHFGKKEMPQALRAGLGSVVGFLGGTLMKFLLGLILILTFVFTAYF